MESLCKCTAAHGHSYQTSFLGECELEAKDAGVASACMLLAWIILLVYHLKGVLRAVAFLFDLAIISRASLVKR